MVIIFIVMYILPFWGFIGMKGANNAVGMIFTFVLYSMFLMEISICLKSKNGEEIHKTLNNQKVYGKKYYIAQWLKYIAIIFTVASFIFAVLTLFIPNMLFLPDYEMLKNMKMV